MKKLHIDIETYCEQDLPKTGVYAYAEHSSLEILLLAYAYDDDIVRILDLSKRDEGVDILSDILRDLTDANVTKIAHNALFEMTCLSNFFNLELDPNQWKCTMIMAYTQGYPGSLGALANVLKLDVNKMTVGKQMINYFSKPCKPTKTNGKRTRNLPHHDWDKWEVFKTYCMRDVEVERAIFETLSSKPVLKFEHSVFVLDYHINKRGIRIDHELVHSALEIDAKVTEDVEIELKELTQLPNPNSTVQFKQYLARKGIETSSFTKAVAEELYDQVSDSEVKRAIELKLMLSKASVKKYGAMVRAEGADHRIRGAFQYYGASRTGRWAGRLVQLQNLKQNHLDDLDYVRELVRLRDIDSLEVFYDEPIPEILGQLVRTAFIPKDDHKFIVADFSAIEARVIAWLAKEKWRIDVFNTHGKIYEASASQMFKVPIENVTKANGLRQKGKVAELALGYGGSVGALRQMGALDQGLKENELQPLVDAWRQANRRITKLWYDVNSCAIKVIKDGGKVRLRNLTFSYSRGTLSIVLPSKRELVYQQAEVVKGKFGNDSVRYKQQVGSTWQDTETHGGKLVENIVQAVARDCLAVSMLRLDQSGYTIVGHVHDEVIIEASKEMTVDSVCEIMSRPISWAKGLNLTAEGYEGSYYFKDD